MNETAPATIKIEIEINKDTLWQAAFGGGWEFSSWWRSLKYGVGGDWDSVGDGSFTISIDNPDDQEKALTKTLTIDDLARAWAIAVKDNYRHCGTAWNLEDTDNCVSNGLLQLAFFGEIIYG
jgi:hypothetical protein